MKLVKKLFKHSRNIPIFFRLSFITLFVFIILALQSFIYFKVFASEKKGSTYNMVNQTNHQAISKIDDYLIDIMNISKLPLTYKQNDSTYLRALNNFNATNIAAPEFQKMNEQMFEDILTYKKNIDSCFIFNLTGAADYKVRTPIYQVMNPLDSPWFNQSIERFGKPIIVDTYELPYVAYKQTPVYVFGISRGVVRIENGTVIGVLLVNTKIDYLKDICDTMKITDGHRIIILHDNYTIYDTDESNITLNAATELTDINWDDTEKLQSIIINDQEVLASSLISKHSGWRIISLIPTAELFHDLRTIQISNIILHTVLIIITLLLIIMVSFQIVHPLRKLVLLMRLAEDGDFNAKINSDSNDEIGILSRSFNSMISKINSLIQEVYLDQIKKSELELQMLQAQINPHFLYNTLESISMMATINDDDTTAEMAANLGSILRYGISKSNAELSVREELDYLEKYISLQHIRFKSIYTIEINVDPSLYTITIIKLILQPILENSICHGMKDIRSGGKIIITAYRSNKTTLVFEVTDNGKGMTEGQVENLNGYINGENNFFDSIGLKNVNKRIKIRYGEQYGIIVQSSKETGTKVIVTLPIDMRS